MRINTCSVSLCLSAQSTEQVAAFCRSLHDMNPLECPMSSSSSSSSSSLSPSPVSALPPTAGTATQRQLSHADKLRKVINELVETERTYVKVSTSSPGALLICLRRSLPRKSVPSESAIHICIRLMIIDTHFIIMTVTVLGNNIVIGVQSADMLSVSCGLCSYLWELISFCYLKSSVMTPH